MEHILRVVLKLQGIYDLLIVQGIFKVEEKQTQVGSWHPLHSCMYQNRRKHTHVVTARVKFKHAILAFVCAEIF